MVFNGADSDQFSRNSPTRGQNNHRVKALNRHFRAETALLNLQCTRALHVRFLVSLVEQVCFWLNIAGNFAEI